MRTSLIKVGSDAVEAYDIAALTADLAGLLNDVATRAPTICLACGQPRSDAPHATAARPAGLAVLQAPGCRCQAVSARKRCAAWLVTSTSTSWPGGCVSHLAVIAELLDEMHAPQS